MLLYKYLTPKKVEDWLIKRDVILLTPPIFLNDVFEFRARRVPACDAELRSMFEEFQSKSPSSIAYEEYKESVTRPEFIEREPEDLQRGLSSMIGVTSLTRHPDSELMWAHYGLNSGVAIGYESIDEVEMNLCKSRFTPLGRAFEVDYGDEILPISEGFLNAMRVFSRKRKCWQYEGEWRVFSSLDQASRFPVGEKTYYGIPALRDQIRHLAFGINANQEFIQKVLEWLGSDKVKVQKVKVDFETNAFVLRDCII